jgi:SAM-dependent methyltransferase
MQPMTTSPKLKANWRRLKSVYHDTRSAEQITEHYLLERTLAARLRDAPAEMRSTLYGELYGELYARLPHHPRYRQRRDDSLIGKQAAVLRKLVPADARLLEVGASDCSVSLAMADHCREVIAVDVTEPAAITERAPANFRFELTDGIAMPFASNSIDFVYSHQLMEHLHPEDAERQLAEIHRVLRPGGCYLCITPSRLTGPHDVSRFFKDEAQGFHLKEYTYQDFDRLFGGIGFGKMRACITRGRHYAGSMPLKPMILLERIYVLLPRSLRRYLGTNRGVRAVLGLAILAYRPTADPR